MKFIIHYKNYYKILLFCLIFTQIQSNLFSQNIDSVKNLNFYKYLDLNYNKSNIENNGFSLVDKWLDYYYGKHPIFEDFTVNDWQLFFEKKYIEAQRKKNNELLLKFSIPLSYIYHSQEKYLKAKPFLEILYLNKAKLNFKVTKSVLIKLEECYRYEKNLNKAIKIRNERIKLKFIDNLWEIYRDFFLYDLAIQDFISNEIKPSKYGISMLRYYMYFGELYFLNNQVELARKQFEKGLFHTNLLISQNGGEFQIDQSSMNYYLGYFVGKIAICDINKIGYKKTISKLIYNNSLNNSDLTNKKFVWTSLAMCYIKIKDSNLASKSINKIKYFSELTKYDTIDYSNILSDYFELINKKDSAIFYLKLNSIAKNLQFKKIIQNKSTILLIKYENEKLNNKLINQKMEYDQLMFVISYLAIMLIILLIFYIVKLRHSKKLGKINNELKITSTELVISNKNKNLLLKELNHRVKNNLQLIISFMNIKMRSYNKNNPIELFVEDIQNRILIISSIYENIYKTESYEILKLNVFIPEICNKIGTLHQSEDFKFNIEYQIDSIEVSSNIGFLISLILNETISNSIKYAFSRKSIANIINIKISKINENEISFLISDNGNGMINNMNKIGFGLSFIKLISQQINSKYDFETSENGVSHKFIIII